MSDIYQGDSGTKIILTITSDNGIVDLTNTTVEVVIKYKATGIKKIANIIDAPNGKVEITLDETDIANTGAYVIQATVKYTNGDSFSSSIQRFVVNKKIGYVPVVGAGTSDIGSSSINGNLIIDGIEIKVYDDALIRGDINNLKLSQHVHTNKDTLDRLGVNLQNHLTIDGVEQSSIGGVGGSTVSDSSINGNILINGAEVKIYDDTILKNQIAAKQATGDYATRTELSSGLLQKADTTQLHSHTNKTILDQIEQPYTTAEKSKLANIESGAEINTVTSVNGQIGDVTITVPNSSGVPPI
jgi:hypothetical protein